MRRSFLTIVTLLAVTYCTAQRGLVTDRGAFSSGIGGVATVLAGADGVFGNFSRLTQNHHSSFILSSSRRFSLSELSSYSLGAHVPVASIGHLGLSISSYGFDLYKEQALSLMYGRQLGDNFSISTSLGYQSLAIEDYGRKGSFLFGIGISGAISETLNYGVMISNPESRQISDSTPIISEIQVGFEYLVSAKVTAFAEAEKSLEEKLNFKIGVDYRIHSVLSLRAGFNTEPGNTSFGFSYKIIPKLKLDAAFIYDSLLGITPIISLKWAHSQNHNSKRSIG